jgi:hypothetical protein
MNSGDIIVEAVYEDLVVSDIRYNVPRGVGTVIPGNLACDSRDLGRLMSEKRIIPFGSNPRLDNKLSTQPRPVQPDPVQPDLLQVDWSTIIESPEVLDLRDQLQKAQDDLSALSIESQRLKVALEESRIECGKLLADSSKLRAEISKIQAEDSKLNTILGKLDNLPTRVVTQEGTTQETKDKLAADESDVPYFFATFSEPVSQNLGKARTNVVEIKGETPGEALKKFRKSKNS